MNKTPKKRLDQILMERGFFETRAKAQAAVLAAQVFVDGAMVDKPGTSFRDTIEVEVKKLGEDYSSRGGKKLEGAISEFKLDVAGLVCLDVGASTGGFTDCLLKHGAAKVYAVDVGYGLIDDKLRRDPRVKTIERLNIRYATGDEFDEKPDLTVVDVSFISLKIVLPVLERLGMKRIVALVKPQFEAGKGQVGKGGVVRDPKIHESTVAGVIETAVGLGYELLGRCESPLKGPKGNLEFFVYLVK